MIKRLARLVAAFVFIAAVFGNQIAVYAAISNQAHSKTEETFNNGVYLVTAYSTDVTAPTSTLDIYFKTKPSTAFTIDVIDADMCKTNAKGFTSNPYTLDAGFSSITAADNKKEVTYYTATWGSSSKKVTGLVNMSTANPPSPTCTKTISLTAAQAAAIPFDNTTNSWKMGFTASGRPSANVGFEYVNVFRVVVNNPSALVSYRGYKSDGANWSKYIYAVDAQGRFTDYGNITFPISPDCSVPDGTTVTRSFYISDPDNGNVNVQPNPWYVRLMNLSTGKLVPIVASSKGTEKNGTDFYPANASGITSIVSYKMTGGVNYRWEHINVFDNNTVKFSMPFDSIGCQYPTATATPKVTAASATSVGTNPINFTKSVTITNYQSTPFAVSYKVSRKVNNGAYADISSSTLNGVNANGTYALAGETYTPAVGDTSVCYKLTLLSASPTPNFVTLNPPSEDCTTITPPPVPPSITLTGTTYEKGAGGAANITATLNCNTYAGSVVWSTSNGSGLTNGSWTDSCVSGGTFTHPVNANTGNALDGKAPGNYNYTASASSPSGVTPAAPVAVNVYEVPFVRFFGQDISVCGSGDTSQFMFDTANGKKGSFSSLATIFNSLGSNTFAGLHTEDPSGSRDKIRSTWSSLVAGACNSQTITFPADSSALTSGVDLSASGKRYYKTTNASISGTLGGQVTIKDSGSVTISGDIINNAIPTNAFTPATMGTAPVLLIKAQNIYISPNVKRIDAVLFASGDIYTCGNGASPARANWDNLPSDSPAGCRSTLIINGALYASNVHFMRSTGTRLLANTSTSYAGFGAPATDNTNPAEVVNYPAYLNFMPLNLPDDSSSKPDAYFNMPPRL